MKGMLANTLFLLTSVRVHVCAHAAVYVGKEVRLLDLQKIGGAANSAALLFALL